MGASGLDGPGVVVGSIVGLVLVAKKRSRNGRWPNHILQVVCGGSFSTSGNTRIIPVFFAESNLKTAHNGFYNKNGNNSSRFDFGFATSHIHTI